MGAFLFALIVLALFRLLYWIGRMTLARGHWTYEIDDYNGDLLYIGECADLKARMRRHRAFQSKLPDGHRRKWWPQVHPDVAADEWPSRVKWHASKELAKEHETQSIRAKRPPANVIKFKGVSASE